MHGCLSRVVEAAPLFPTITAVTYGDYTGFTKLWDGATLRGWEGESDVWSIVNGTIHADTTKTPGQITCTTSGQAR